MKNLFDAGDCASLCARINALDAGRPRQWGKMNAAQMLCHCGRPLETAIGDKPLKQRLIGKILAPLVRGSIFSEKPMGRNAPTDPTFKVGDDRDFAAERARLLALIARFVECGSERVAKAEHSFFGTLTGEQWGQLMYKHIDHHLQQFGA